MVNNEGREFYLHVKTNNVYEVLNSEVINATNSRERESMVLYKNLHEDKLFVRTSTEFYDGRFLPIEDTEGL